jgi:uncharacterized protein YfaP (DUF2135 family)
MSQIKTLISLALALLLTAFAVIAQDADVRLLTPGVPVEGTINAAAPAQVYTFAAGAGSAVSLTVSADEGLALTAVVTDSGGVLVAQAVDTALSGTLSLDGIPLSAAGLYYVTIFPAAGVEGSTTEGSFTVTLEGEAAAVITEEPVAEATEEPAAEPTPEPTVTPSTVTPDTFQTGQFLSTTGIQVSLNWNNAADLNLQVRDPVGQTLFFDSRTTNNGGTFGFDVNGLCEVITTENATETATYAPGAVPTGSYEILVFYRQDCQNQGPTSFTVNAVVDGTALEPITATLPAPQNNNSAVHIASFDLGDDGSVAWKTSGPYQDTRVLPKAGADFVAEAAQPITTGETIRGVITSDQYYQLYTFEARAGESISVSMTALNGNLDTLLLVLNRAGQIVADNDDIEIGINTNSSISNPPLTIVSDGVYTILATRYGKDVGGTEGVYDLQVNRLEFSELTNQFVELGLPQGDIEIYLQWNTFADLQLLVRAPDGQAVYDDEPVINSGGRLEAAGNRDCTVFAGADQPVSYIYWPFGTLRGGSYEIEVWYQNQCNDTTPVSATLLINVSGRTVFTQSIGIQPNQRFITSFTVDAANQVTTGGAGISGSSETIPFTPAEVEGAPEIISGQTQRGNISLQNEYDLYVFNGTAGDTVTISMRKTQGVLDTKLFLISPSGFEVADNDDFLPGETTDSLIQNFVLPETGRYVIIGTKFGTIYGATAGSYEISLQQTPAGS